jgi:hypothetical protein
VAIRDSSYKPDPTSKGVWPSDKQGYSQIAHSDTAQNWAQHQKQWVRTEVTFTAPSDMVSVPATTQNLFLQIWLGPQASYHCKEGVEAVW